MNSPRTRVSSAQDSLTVISTGAQALLQDLGRPGYAAMGVGASGAADRGAHALANRLVGNPVEAATIEVLLGGLQFTVDADVVIAVTGAPAPITVGGRRVDDHSPVYVAAGEIVRLGTPPVGLRSYVAVAGGFAEQPVLGSRSFDTLARLGPAPLAPGRVLPIGDGPLRVPGVDHAPVRLPRGECLTVRVLPGPRDEWLANGLDALCGRSWAVSSRSDRIAVRLEGDSLDRSPGFAAAELPSEGVVRGGVQVPSGGLPVVFLSDHPVTGGYPVVGVVAEADIDRIAQARPGQEIRFVFGSRRSSS